MVNPMRRVGYGTDGRTSLRQLLIIKKEELENQIKKMRAAQSIHRHLGRLAAPGDSTTYSNRQREYDASIVESVRRALPNGVQELENIIATTETALQIWQNLEEYLACHKENSLNLDTVNNRRAVGSQSDENISSDILSQEILQAIMLMNASQVSLNAPWSKPLLPTTFLMAIHAPSGKTIIHVAKLDTASRQNLISRRLTSSIGLEIEAYKGPALQPIGPSFSPADGVTIDWHVSGRPTIHRTDFAVLDELPGVALDFDILLSEHEIQKVGFYRRNCEVFYIQ